MSSAFFDINQNRSSQRKYFHAINKSFLWIDCL